MVDNPNFGHSAAHGFVTFMDSWGDGPLLIRHGKRKWWFEFSDMFGPTLLRASDKEPSDQQPTSKKDPFWVPFQAWMGAGKKCRAVKNERGQVQYWVCHAPVGERLP